MSSLKKDTSGLVKLARTSRVPKSVPDLAIHAILSELDCPRSLAVWIIYSNDPAQLKTLAFDPLHYNDVDDFRDAYLATKLLSKAEFLKLGLDRRALALSKFFDYEERCKVTNNRFKDLAFDPLFKGPNTWLLNATQRKIASILVGFSPEELFEEANWGPGVSTRVKGAYTHAANKFQCETGITRDLYDFVAPLLADRYPLWSGHLAKLGFPHFDVGNKVTTVAKDAFIDRVIAIEPGLNLWFQKAIGEMIRRRLRRFGIDLDRQELNQSGARVGSYDSSLATVDFSSASDSVSSAIVEELIPQHWYRIMDLSRSHFGIIDGKSHRWSKFSSMGNGFTFELETVIFYAAAVAVCEYLHVSSFEVKVYGDDVILPSSAFDLYSSFCEFLGFSVNKAKSFNSSPFRESCGAHYWDAKDVKPLYLKRKPANVLELYRWINAVRRLAHRRGWYYPSCDIRLRPAWVLLYKSVPKKLRLFGSDGYGDGFIIGNFDESHPSRARHGLEGFRVRGFQEQAVKLAFDGVGQLLDRLWNGAFERSLGKVPLRGRTRISITKILVPQWKDLGPWI